MADSRISTHVLDIAQGRPAQGIPLVTSFYPEIVVIFSLRDVTQSYHIPLLLSPFGYSTYRGS